jgi:BolA family transcriptional regulator, general stress-responsive regulator
MSIQETIIQKLSAAFTITHLQVENESHKHNVPKGSESHFKVVLASVDFDGMRQVARHQAIYKVLADELKQGVHALAVHTYTPQEWLTSGQAPASPDCMGGSKH